MADKAWKQFERRVAAFFGVKRRACSGSYGHLDNKGRDDCMHEQLFIECKQGKQCLPISRLYEQTAELAEKEGRLPILALQAKHKKGFLIVVHCDDLQTVAAQVHTPPKKIPRAAKPKVKSNPPKPVSIRGKL